MKLKSLYLSIGIITLATACSSSKNSATSDRVSPEDVLLVGTLPAPYCQSLGFVQGEDNSGWGSSKALKGATNKVKKAASEKNATHVVAGDPNQHSNSHALAGTMYYATIQGEAFDCRRSNQLQTADSCKSGNGLACDNMADTYISQAKSVSDQSFKEGRDFRKKACDLGVQRACYLLKAFSLSEKCRQTDHADTCFKAGLEYGKVTPSSIFHPHIAKMEHFKLACERGHKISCKNLERQMAQTAQAERISREQREESLKMLQAFSEIERNNSEVYRNNAAANKDLFEPLQKAFATKPVNNNQPKRVRCTSEQTRWGTTTDCQEQ